jgi:hypothetical protein
MKTGDKKIKEIKIEGFVFELEIEKLNDKKTYSGYQRLYMSSLESYKRVRMYRISIRNLGSDNFEESALVWGCELNYFYKEYVEKANDFTSFMNDNDDLTFMN